MTTNYVQFEQAGVPHDERMYDAQVMLDRVAAFFADDGLTLDDWLDRAEQSWETAVEA